MLNYVYGTFLFLLILFWFFMIAEAVVMLVYDDYDNITLLKPIKLIKKIFGGCKIRRP